MFPQELPRRLVWMSSLWGEAVLDSFVGSGTMVKASLALSRYGMGYEIQPAFEPLIREKLGIHQPGLWSNSVRIEQRIIPIPPIVVIDPLLRIFVRSVPPNTSPQNPVPLPCYPDIDVHPHPDTKSRPTSIQTSLATHLTQLPYI